MPASAPAPVPDHATLHRLLDAQLALPPEYRRQLTSHLPMALQALHALGANAARLQAFNAAYLPRLGPLNAAGQAAAESSAPAVSWSDWQNACGRMASYAALRAHFAQALAMQGQPAVLRQALPLLWPGLAAAGLHGPIRLAHALQSGHSGELAAALAYWAARWQPLPVPPRRSALSFADWAARLTAAPGLINSPATRIAARMEEASATPAYAELAAALQTGPDTLDQLEELVLDDYIAWQDFTVLHLVTGLHAVRQLLSWLDAPDLAPVIRAATAAWLAALRLPQPAASGSGIPAHADWPALLDAARASTDDHAIKLVHVCHAHAQALRLQPAASAGAMRAERYRQAAVIALG
ncbi:questin oxidase family protein [Ideonella sp.]|uniref:questin oxidase family protein n=1 Tax=Ideonella sp. TaxID=1929293 RepID=UPI003BB7D410